MVDLIREVDKKASDTFKKGKGPSKAIFLSRFWDDHCPTFSKLYVDVQLGHRYMNTSPNFYNDPEFLAPDYWVHVTPLDVNDLNRAVTLLNTLLQANLDDGVARIGLGYALLELGEYQKADDSFMLALKTLRKEPCIYNGRGLAWVKREKGSQMARDHFRDALALDRNYEAASYNLAMSQVSLRATDVPFHIRKVTRAFPDHQDAYYKLGVWHEIGSRFDNEFLSEAMDAYQAQTGANAGHYAAWSNLARIKMKMGHPGDAIGICKRVLEEAPVYRIRVLPTLMEAYQAVRQIAEADKAATRYVAMLDPKTREHFLDISLITSRKEKALLDGLSGKAIDEFRHDFWMRHDPTPGTPENEKRVEHVRRVGIAMVLYSEATKPWDTRGDVYIRYGEPRHKSRSDNMRFETDPSVVRVRDRLLGALSDVERNEIRQSHRRIRTSTRDVEKVTNESGSFSIVVNDFEPAEFGYDPGAGDNRMGAPDPNEKEYQTGLIESINDRIPPQEIRGLPLFPVEGNRPWEYWVYPDVGDGIEVVFTAFNQHGGYGFAEPLPTGRKVSRFNRQTFVRLRPENVVIKAITRQPSLLRMHHIPLEFAYDAADFRGSRDQTRMELYVGRIGGLVGDTVRTDASMILYDKSWNPVFESSGEFSHVMGRDADSLQTIEIDGEVPPGEYILAVQIDDPTTGAMGSQRLGVEIEAFVDSVLSISDIAFASSMVEDSTTRRGGFRMTPHPWRKYAPTDPVVVYYEIYGLADDSFGQTQYQMDYQITPLDGGTLSAKVLRGIGRQLGVEQRESLTISYARTGEDADEFSYVEIDVAGSAPGSYELTVTITDSVTGQRASKRRAFTIDRVD
jgi:GWxTD domain-containing protein